MIPTASDAGRRARLAAAMPGVAALGALALLAPLGDASLEAYQLPKELWLVGCALLGLLAAAPRRHVDLLDGALVASCAVAVAAAALAVNPWIGARLAAVTVAGTALAWLVREAPPASRARTEVLVLAGLGLAALLVLVETFGGLPGLSTRGRAPGATLGHRNAVAHVLALGLPFLLRAASAADRPRARALALAGTALLAAAIVATRCRAAWLSLGASVAVMTGLGLASARLRRRALLPLAAALAGALAILAPRPALPWASARPYLDTWERLFDAEHGSGRGRVGQARASLRLWRDSPLLGVGPGNWTVAYPGVATRGEPGYEEGAWTPLGRLLTSDLVAWPVERGALGALAALAVLAALARTTWRATDRDHAAAALGTGVALVPLVALDSVLQVAAPVAVLAALLPPAVAPGAPERTPRARALAFALSLALAPALVHRAVELGAYVLGAESRATPASLARAVALDPGDYDARVRLAQVRIGEGRCDAALPLLTEAIHLRPANRRPRLERDRCLRRLAR